MMEFSISFPLRLVGSYQGCLFNIAWTRWPVMNIILTLIRRWEIYFLQLTTSNVSSILILYHRKVEYASSKDSQEAIAYLTISVL